MTLRAMQNPAPRPRRDGWTPARRRAFLDLLRDGFDVRRAAARVGMSRRSAYCLRKRDHAFAREWDAAVGASREEKGRWLVAEAVERFAWARAAFPRAAAEGGGFFSQDTVTGVTGV